MHPALTPGRNAWLLRGLQLDQSLTSPHLPWWKAPAEFVSCCTCLRWEALDAQASAGDVPRWPPPVQLDVPMVLRLQCNITDDRSSAGGGNANRGAINEQATANE